jgi:hypothetical protein
LVVFSVGFLVLILDATRRGVLCTRVAWVI